MRSVASFSSLTRRVKFLNCGWFASPGEFDVSQLSFMIHVYMLHASDAPSSSNAALSLVVICAPARRMRSRAIGTSCGWVLDTPSARTKTSYP